MSQALHLVVNGGRQTPRSKEARHMPTGYKKRSKAGDRKCQGTGLGPLWDMPLSSPFKRVGGGRTVEICC